MSTPRTADATTGHGLPAALRLGAVHLTVTDLERSLRFYQGAVGLRVHERDATRATLGAGGDDLVELVEEPSARPMGRHAGLFHLALLFESRDDLAHAALRLAATSTPLTGASDHGVSEALYLRDPDGNGVELYADRPRSSWPPPSGSDRIGMFTAALDLDGLLGLVAGQKARPHAGSGLIVGHVHLTVNDIDEALHFYRDVLGFDLVADIGSARFLSAGGYHHHVGANVWQGVGIPPAPRDGTVGLRHWTVMLSSDAEIEAVRARIEADGAAVEGIAGGFMTRDPAGIAVAFVSAGS